MSDHSGEQCSPPIYSSTPGILWNMISSLLALTLNGTIFSKLSFNVIPYPLLKITAGKVLRETFLRVIMLFLKILSNVTPLLGINANLSLFDTSLSALTPPPSLQKEKILLCWEKATGSTSVNVRGGKKKGAARQGKFTANAKLTPAA